MLVTTQGSPDFVPPAERIAVFDDDGTLWCEQPIYFQLASAIDRIKALEPQHPEWKEKEPFKSILAGNLKAALAGGEHAAVEIVMATHAGMTTDDFEKSVADWIATARHPKTGKLYTEMTYQPMVELLTCLRAKGFKTFIVSGGGIEFMRVFAERVYGIPPEQVIGSSIKSTFEMRDGKAVLMKQPELFFFDDKAGKPVATGDGARFALVVHHTDAEREFAYDRKSHVGKLDKALDEAAAKGWTVVDMKDEWKAIFPSN